ANHSQRFARVKPIPASRVPSTPVFGEVFFNRLDALRGRLARRNERPPTACTRSFAIVSATCEKSLSHAGFCNTVEFDAAIATTTRAVSLDCAHHTHSVLDSARRAARRRPQDSLFFCCAVVIIVQCSSIRDCTAIASLIMARRAEWRRRQSR